MNSQSSALADMPSDNVIEAKAAAKRSSFSFYHQQSRLVPNFHFYSNEKTNKNFFNLVLIRPKFHPNSKGIS